MAPQLRLLGAAVLLGLAAGSPPPPPSPSPPSPWPGAGPSPGPSGWPWPRGTRAWRPGPPLTHLALEPATGRLFAAGLNRLFQLSPGLRPLRARAVGPVAGGGAEGAADNVIGLLLLEGARGRLLACGSGWRGGCRLHRLADLAPLGRPSEPCLAPGPGPPAAAVLVPGPPARLFVGTAVAGRAEALPTLASRRLPPDPASPDMLALAYQDAFAASQVKVPSDTRARRPAFDIAYVAAFRAGPFVYFVALQLDPGAPEGRAASRLVRLCAAGDPAFHSYVEFPLGCARDGVEYRLVQAARLAPAGRRLARALGVPEGRQVLFAAFARGQKHPAAPPPQSLLCLFPLDRVDRLIQERIQGCYRGEGRLSLPWLLNKDLPCISTPLEIAGNFCGLVLNQPLGGLRAIQGVPVLAEQSEGLASLAAYTYRGHSVVFLGTRAGTLKKVRVDGPGEAQVYESVPVAPGQPLLRDMELSPDRRHLYVLSPQQVVRLPVETCGQYGSCEACLGAGDPHCGWCVLHGRCCRDSECPRAEEPRRFALAPGLCVRLHLEPSNVSVGAPSLQVRVTAHNLPELGAGVACAFEGLEEAAAQALPGGALGCPAPPPPPAAPQGAAWTLSLGLRSLETGAVVASAPFILFDCARLRGCLACVSSRFACRWCTRRHACAAEAGACPPAEGPVDTPQGCPALEAGGGLLVPAGVPQPLTLAARNLPEPGPGRGGYECLVGVRGQRRRLPALRLNASALQCHNASYWYEGDAEAEVALEVAVVWDGDFPIDQLPGFAARLYKCGAQGASCGRCLRADPRLGCGWCPPQGRCLLRPHCPPPAHGAAPGGWLPPGHRCTHPRIDQVEPLRGPPAGGTRVTVTGENLGLEASEVGVRVAGVPCTPLPAEYVPAERVVCELGRPPVPAPPPGPVELCLGDCGAQLRARSRHRFAFVTPTVWGLWPAGGPVSGGTQVTVSGTHLDAGSEAAVTLRGAPCPLLRRSPTALVCLSPPSAVGPGPAPLAVRVDRTPLGPPPVPPGARPPGGALAFRYSPDPTVTGVAPLWSIANGSTPLTVTGTRLRSVQAPRVRALFRGLETLNSCEVLSDAVMVCQAPGLGGAPALPPAGAPPDELGFVLDGVAAPRALNPPGFTYFPDPQLEPFPPPGRLRVQPGAHVAIKGRNLVPGGARLNFSVLLGGRPCAPSVSPSRLLCQAPAQPGRHPVTVRVAALAFAPGTLEVAAGGAPRRGALAGLGAAGLGLLLAGAVGLGAVGRRARAAARRLRRLQLQLDTLESRVALECKEAFAELQTDIQELAGAGAGDPIPFRDFRSYVLRVLFPGGAPGPPGQAPAGSERGLRALGQLLLCRGFLVTVVRCLEGQRGFGMRDRAAVAALATLALAARLDQLTRVLRQLLADLMDKSLRARAPPKLLLRRTESVAEKMLTNWFTFLLHRFLKESAGEPLFTLFCAIKQQVEKGPIDAVTGEARYSLSEDKLIRQQIDYRTLTLLCACPDPPGGPAVAVKVLDCDTVTQAKDKLLDAVYRGVPHSLRPQAADLDLEWRGAGAPRVLQDEDGTSRVEGDWKRINTLEHYQVPDGASVALLHRAPPGPPLPGSCAAGPHEAPRRGTLERDGGTRLWHLVRAPDPPADPRGPPERGSKMVSEIYLTRLLATKGTLQRFVDALLEAVLSAAPGAPALPLPIKYMFDFLDAQAARLHGADPDVPHAWKSNCLPLRFWVNVIKNPQFVFDVHKSSIADACLSVVAQTFMDACSTSPQRLGKDSPSTKLLYAKDLPAYRAWVERYYRAVGRLAPISEGEMDAFLAEQSRLHAGEFDTLGALGGLYQYVGRYRDEVLAALERDAGCRQQRLRQRLEQVLALLGPPA
ncbi:plexin-A3 [Struthio camelus]|uniref:plexin-A3 n=1 Tax=Struthio camelus TaxID=8801 RepID=UPI003603BBD5